MFWKIFFGMLAVRVLLKVLKYHEDNTGLRVASPNYWRRRWARERQLRLQELADRAEQDRYQAINREREARIAAKRQLQRKNLAALNLQDFPVTAEQLKTARNEAMFIVHPDRGGSEQDAIRVNDAYEELMRYLGLDKLKKAA